MGRFRKIYVNTSHRVSGTSTNFRYELAEDQDCGGGEIKCHLAITSVSLPNAFFTVMSNVNNKLYIWEQHPTTATSSQNRTIGIAAGQYSLTSLATAIQSGLNTNPLASATYTATPNHTTQRITITQVNGGGFLIMDDTTLKNIGRKDQTLSGSYNQALKVANPQSLQQLLNIPSVLTLSVPDVSFTSGVVNLARTPEVFIRSPNLTNSSTLDCLGRSDVIKRIPIDVSFGYQVVTGSNVETSDLMDVSGRTLRSLDFVLTDASGNQVDLHGLDWGFVMNFVYGDLE